MRVVCEGDRSCHRGTASNVLFLCNVAFSSLADPMTSLLVGTTRHLITLLCRKCTPYFSPSVSLIWKKRKKVNNTAWAVLICCEYGRGLLMCIVNSANCLARAGAEPREARWALLSDALIDGLCRSDIWAGPCCVLLTRFWAALLLCSVILWEIIRFCM